MMAAKRATKPDVTEEDIREMIRMGRNVKRMIRIFAAILIMCFAWLRFADFDFGPITDDLTALFLQRLALLLYFISWVWGAIYDTNVQIDMYLRPPSRGRLTATMLGLCITLLLVFGVLCYVDDLRKFGLVLAAFWTVNIIGYAYLVKKVIPGPLQTTREKHEYDATTARPRKHEAYWKLEKLSLVRAYMMGKWQVYRFGTGGLMIVAINLLAFTTLSDAIALRGATSSDFVVTLGILLFVLAVEGWMTAARLQLLMDSRRLAALATKYKLTPLAGSG